MRHGLEMGYIVGVPLHYCATYFGQWQTSYTLVFPCSHGLGGGQAHPQHVLSCILDPLDLGQIGGSPKGTHCIL